MLKDFDCGIFNVNRYNQIEHTLKQNQKNYQLNSFKFSRSGLEATKAEVVSTVDNRKRRALFITSPRLFS